MLRLRPQASAARRRSAARGLSAIALRSVAARSTDWIVRERVAGPAASLSSEFVIAASLHSANHPVSPLPARARRSRAGRGRVAVRLAVQLLGVPAAVPDRGGDRARAERVADRPHRAGPAASHSARRAPDSSASASSGSRAVTSDDARRTRPSPPAACSTQAGVPTPCPAPTSACAVSSSTPARAAAAGSAPAPSCSRSTPRRAARASPAYDAAGPRATSARRATPPM